MLEGPAYWKARAQDRPTVQQDEKAGTVRCLPFLTELLLEVRLLEWEVSVKTWGVQDLNRQPDRARRRRTSLWV